MTDGNDSINVTRFRDGEENGIGLTKREHFASLAMQGMLSNSLGLDQSVEPFHMFPPDRMATTALQFADALINELNK